MKVPDFILEIFQMQCTSEYSFDNNGFSDLNWHNTIEGDLFWYILNSSYVTFTKYDYITIAKLYHKYGKDIFKKEIFYLHTLYENSQYIDSEIRSLNSEGFDILCDILDGKNNILDL